ncbi:MAG TPA: citrate synthase, partial [Acidimicrobiales bacterium]|nr:citrate synthase [Acidimicrobiales bacterium]
MTRMLESEEAARRLGVKLPTLYAYVSRGLLVSHPSPDGRRSLFDLEDLEELSRRSRGARRTDARLATVTTAVTQLREDGPSYRGRRVVELARTAGFEDVAALLWDAEPLPPAQWQPAALPPSPALPSATRLQWAVVLCGARDPLRSDTRPAAVVQKARSLIASAVDALPVLGPRRAARGSAADRGAPLAARVARRYSTSPPQALVRAIDAALVLLADHELATSTLAVRLA